ncbi:MAG TPA: hypothetical protein VI959_04665 [Alphaproteobacteria bacterium]|nr:hypothetical protein [Alphaproteobacteria bacterium]
MRSKKTYKVLKTLERVQQFYLDQVVFKRNELIASVQERSKEIEKLEKELQEEQKRAIELMQKGVVQPSFYKFEEKYRFEKTAHLKKIKELESIIEKVQEQLVILYQEKEISNILKQNAKDLYEEALNTKERKEQEDLSVIRYALKQENV